MGIYVIKQIGKPREYVGSAADIHHRAGSHLRDLVSGRHHSTIMQRIFNKQREMAFTVRILQTVEDAGQSGQAALKAWRDSLSPEEVARRKAEIKSAQERWHREQPEAKADAIRRMKETKARKTPEQRAQRLALFRESMRKKREAGWTRKLK